MSEISIIRGLWEQAGRIALLAILLVSLASCSHGSKESSSNGKTDDSQKAAGLSTTEIKNPTPAETLAELKLAEQTFKMPSDLPVRLDQLALRYGTTGHYKEAINIESRVVDLCQKPQISDRLQLATSLNSLGMLYMWQKRYGKAEPLLQSSLVMQQDLLGKTDPGFANSVGNLATLYYEQARYKDALPLFKHALEILELHPEKNREGMAKYVNNVASCYSYLGDSEKAQQYLEKALKLEEKMPVVNNGNLATALNNLGYIYEIAGKYDKAEPLLQRGLSLAESAYGSNSLELVSFLDNNAYLLRKTKRTDDAEKLKKRANQILVANNR